MRFADMVVLSFNSLRHRSIRSWLTVLGIVVGITAIVLLVGLVQGLKDDVTKQLAGFGSQTIVVIPVNMESGASSAGSFAPTSGKLFMKDYERIKRIPDVEYITPVISSRTYVEYKDKQITASVTGVDPDLYAQTQGTLEISKGRFLQSQDHRAAVVGSSLATDYFPRNLEVSSLIFIGGEQYHVVGILNKTGNTFASIDSAILIPFDEAKDLFNDTLADNEVSAIRMTVKDGVSPSSVATRIEDELLASHHVTSDKKDFGVITPEFINKQLDSVMGIITLFLGGIAGISLLVGGIGISNTMFMSVTEREREIGILKSIGARESAILQLFLVESSMIGAAGGFFGIVLAYILGALVTLVAGIGVSISPYVVLGATMFSAFVGIVSGLFPARQAAKLDPIEALRG